jgi:hypothetical protein
MNKWHKLKGKFRSFALRKKKDKKKEEEAKCCSV